MSKVTISPSSSITFIPSRPVTGNAGSDRPERTMTSPASKEAERIEHDMEQYGGDEPQEPPSRTSTSSSPSLPPAKGTGKDPNLVTWDGPDDPENPHNWSKSCKWFIMVVVILMTVNTTFASSAPTATVFALSENFHVPKEVSDLVTTMFLLGYVFGPFFWGPGSELVGRRPIFVVTMFAYTVLHLGQALAPNIQTLLVTRFFAGFFAVAPLSNSGGVISDMFSAEDRGLGASLFAGGVFLGPTLGPLVSGFIIGGGVSWRWVFWVMMIFAGVCTFIAIVWFPETYAPVLLLRKAKRLRKADPQGNADLYAEHERQDWSFYGIVQRTVWRPFHMLLLEPILVLVTIYISIVYGLLYGLFEAFPVIFVVRRGFTIGHVGLIFIGVGIGTSIGALINIWMSRNYPKLVKKWKGFPPPEERLPSGMVGAVALVIATFWLGWTGEYKSIPWYVPALSTVLLGTGISLIFMSFLTYLVDTYLIYSASAFAANTIIRSAVGAVFPLFTVQMFENLHINWAATLIGLIALLFAPSPFLFYKYGARIRRKSRFAPGIDFKIAKELEEEERAQRKETV